MFLENAILMNMKAFANTKRVRKRTCYKREAVEKQPIFHVCLHVQFLPAFQLACFPVYLPLKHKVLGPLGKCKYKVSLSIVFFGN